MNKMKATIQHKIARLSARIGGRLLIALTVIGGLLACTDQYEEENKTTTGETIRLSVSGPEEHAVTKAAPAKETFGKDDIIHISSTFTLDGGATKTVYSCMKNDGKGNWYEFETKSTFKWPWNATNGAFTAYYIPAAGSHTNKNALAPGNIPITLSDLTAKALANGADPLKATRTVAAGGAVHLQFAHICTKLTFVNLSDEIVNSQTLFVKGTEDDITFTLNSADNKLTDVFNEGEENLIRSQAEGNGATGTITFLLPPLVGPNPVIWITKEDHSPYHKVELPRALEAGKHYSLDIRKLADNFVSDDMKEEDWQKPIATEVKLDTDGINAYLTAIRGGRIYIYKDALGQTTQVLDKLYDATLKKNIVIQLVDVDFQENKFTPVNIGSEIIFQANNRKIKNLTIQNTVHDDVTENAPGGGGPVCASLFGKSDGTIKNLIIEDAKMNVPLGVEPASPQYVAILVGENGTSGAIEGVKISFAASGDNAITTASSQIELGGLVGNNKGTIKDCTLLGLHTLKSLREGAGTISYIGGFAGYTSGSITNCQITGAGSIQSEGVCDMYIGGFAGYAMQKGGIALSLCTSSTSVSIQKAEEMKSIRAGGLVGLGENTFEKCVATGTVSVNATSSSETETYYLGGFMGLLLDGTLDNCHATKTVSSTNLTKANIGGLVGWMIYENGTSIIQNSSSTSMVGSANGGLVGKVGQYKEVVSNPNSAILQNSFSKSDATALTPEAEKTNVTITNCHINGTGVGVTGTLLDQLNVTAAANGWLKWTNTPDIYGNGMPYLIR